MKVVDASGNPIRGDDEYVESTTLESVVYDRINPRQVGTGSMRGTQTVGYGNVKIDGSNNRIVFQNPSDNTTINVGVTPDDNGGLTGFGLSVVDSDGFTLFELDGQTWFWYDKVNNKNIMQVGKLPDGSYGWVVAKTGKNVSEIFE